MADNDYTPADLSAVPTEELLVELGKRCMHMACAMEYPLKVDNEHT